MLEDTTLHFEPKVRKVFGVHGDEVIAGFLYLTDLEEVPPKHRVKQTFNFKILELIKTAGQINVSTVFIITGIANRTEKASITNFIQF